MSATAPGKTLTFTIKTLPRTERERKTLQRLMRLQPKVQRTLTRIANVRRRETAWTQRGGRLFARRWQATKIVFPTVGASFTLRITPQIMPDLKSVERFLDSK